MPRLPVIVIIFLILGAVLLPLGDSTSLQAVPENPYLPLQEALETVGAIPVEGELHYWAALTPPSKGEKNIGLADQAIALGAQIGLSGLGLMSSYYPARAGGSFQAFELEKELTPGVTGRLVLQEMEQQGGLARHLLVTLFQKEKTGELAEYAFKMPAVYDPLSQRSSTTYCLTGHLDKKMEQQEMQDAANQIHQTLGGNLLDSGFSEGHLVSVTGYTPALGEFFQVKGGERVNLNIALKYDDYQKKTVIWVGTPLIPHAY